jgi:hypothetical protein
LRNDAVILSRNALLIEFVATSLRICRWQNAWHGRCSFLANGAAGAGPKGELMNNIFYIIGVVVVVLVILGYFGFR